MPEDLAHNLDWDSSHERVTGCRVPQIVDPHVVETRDLADRPIGQLSGGQQQRAFLARAIAQEPHILLMDEPFTGVDVTTQEATLRLLDHLQEKEVTAMVSTHDLNLAGSRFDFVLLLNRRLIAFGKPQDVFTKEYLAQAFGNSLLVTDNGMMLVDECCPPE